MKSTNILPIAISAIALLVTSSAFAEEDNHKDHNHDDHASHNDHKDHDHAQHKSHDEHEGHDHAKKMVGPNGGRIISEVEPHLEFFVMQDRKVKLTAVDDHGKAIKLNEQSVDIIAGDRQNPIKMAFIKEGDSLISDIAFPAGNDFPVVISIKSNPNEKKVRSKFNLNLNECPTCDYKEYACTCEHGEDEHEGHNH